MTQDIYTVNPKSTACHPPQGGVVSGAHPVPKEGIQGDQSPD